MSNVFENPKIFALVTVLFGAATWINWTSPLTKTGVNVPELSTEPFISLEVNN